MTKRNSGDLNSELSINCHDDAKETGTGVSQSKASSPGSAPAKSPVLASNFSSSLSNGSVDDEDASSKENCDSASGQISDGPSSNALLSSDGNLKSKKKGEILLKLLE